ncbi:MAG: C10 family peptidase, partial [Ignavibacteriales bacterium]|nr:C10 family peptidase [Ignavibacteriales bacterium]
MRVVTAVLLFILLVVTGIMYPSPVDRVSANKAAVAKLAELGVQNLYRQTGMQDITSGTDELYGYLVTLSPTGFLLLTADTGHPPVMAYSLENSAGNTEAGNPLLDMFISDITLLNRHKNRVPAGVTRQNNIAWQKLLNGGSREKQLTLLQWPPAGSTSTGGLLTANWTQSAPYNNFCPQDLVAGGSRSLAGCPAVAMAQILNYLKTTNNTTFSDNDDYYHNYGGNRYWIDNDAAQYGFPAFTVLNDYLRSLQSRYASGTAITNTDKAALVFACGVAAKQVYGASGSGTFAVSQAYSAFQKFNFANADLLMPN